MERETGIEPALVAWKATVLPLNYSRPGVFSNLKLWWREVDSNHRRHEPADLQSAPVGRLGIPPGNSCLLPRCSRTAGDAKKRQARCLSFHALNYAPARSRLLSFPRQFLSRRHEKCYPGGDTPERLHERPVGIAKISPCPKRCAQCLKRNDPALFWLLQRRPEARFD